MTKCAEPHCGHDTRRGYDRCRKHLPLVCVKADSDGLVIVGAVSIRPNEALALADRLVDVVESMAYSTPTPNRSIHPAQGQCDPT
ncbi:UNVERIFIED_ORG: hypothetical protein FNL38_1011031 [Nocardia globerula]|uniref:Uncharacterized protein n=1 Tax=Nocardia globerula TaxID=1818 RepID=A0A652YYB1_NOCGL|nr:hypothetical protein [Rhodococcus globerulus]NMD58970.1 hypothetical protein [Nocardia globerula]PVX64965.1 hypothetical protein C8E04_2251 [Rhodococcus globerulus]